MNKLNALPRYLREVGYILPYNFFPYFARIVKGVLFLIWIKLIEINHIEGNFGLEVSKKSKPLLGEFLIFPSIIKKKTFFLYNRNLYAVIFLYLYSRIG